MRQDTAEDRPSLGRLLAIGVLRLGRQARPSKGQAAALALCLAAAVGLGVALEPRRAAEPEQRSTPVSPVPAGEELSRDRVGERAAEGDPAVAAALDRLAAEIAGMNGRLGEAVAEERAARAPVIVPGAGPAERKLAPDDGASPSRPTTVVAAPALRASAARRTSPAAARPRLAPSRRVEPIIAAPRAPRRHARHPGRVRHRLPADLRFFLGGLRLPL